MPKKKYFETDLIRVNIWRNDFKRIKELQRGDDAFYKTFSRIMDIYFAEKAELEYALKIQEEATISWKQKYEKLEKARNQMIFQ